MTITQHLTSGPQLEQAVELQQLSKAAAMVIHCVNHFSGFSLANHGEEMREFLAREGIDDPATLVDSQVSDCGLFALAVWHRIGVHHKFVEAKYVTGMAIAWLTSIAADCNAIRHPVKDGPPKAGALMHYFTPRTNDNHVEFLLSDPEIYPSVWVAFHGGGGRANCGIGIGHSDIKWNMGRPLQEWYDVDALVAAIRAATISHAEPPEPVDQDWGAPHLVD